MVAAAELEKDPAAANGVSSASSPAPAIDITTASGDGLKELDFDRSMPPSYSLVGIALS
jgi:hypothetical protein